MIALKPANIEKLAFSVVKNVLLENISNARNILIRIPLKIAILVLAVILKLLFGSFYNNTKSSVTKQTNLVRSTNAKPNRQSSPSSISVVLSTASDDISVQRKSVSSRLDFGNKTSTYSLIKSVSKSSMVNFFTPNYSLNDCYDKDSLNGFSEINSVKTSNTESIKNELLLNETDLDCDSLESSFYFDLKTQFSEKNLINSSYSIDDDHFNTEQRSKMHDVSGSADRGLPDLINQKGGKDVSTDKARKYLEGLDGVKFNEVQVPDTLKKQLEYFDRDELLQLIAYQKKYLDFKETRIKDLENYIDNLVVKIIETEPLILMNANTVLSKSKNII